jgi:hypothetical protein
MTSFSFASTRFNEAICEVMAQDCWGDSIRYSLVMKTRSRLTPVAYSPAVACQYFQ